MSYMRSQWFIPIAIPAPSVSHVLFPVLPSVIPILSRCQSHNILSHRTCCFYGQITSKLTTNGSLLASKTTENQI